MGIEAGDLAGTDKVFDLTNTLRTPPTNVQFSVNGLPVNMPSHGHGQGYSDLNFLLPELVQRIDYRKGPYFAQSGDFASAGAAGFVIPWGTSPAPCARTRWCRAWRYRSCRP